jgi:hypothetical protein
MSGPDSIRGFNFQHAAALHAALDLLDDPAYERIEIEGDDDVIDFQILGSGDVRLRVAQIRSRSTPIGPQELIDVIHRWHSLPATEHAQFEYVTDAHLGREAASKLVPTIRRLTEGQTLSDTEETYLRSTGVADDHRLLARVRVVPQHPPVGALLTQAEMRVLRLVGIHLPASADDAEAIVDRLFRTIATSAGEGERNLRRLNREQVAEILRVDIASIDADAGWSSERAQQYRKAVLEEPRDDAAVELGLEPVGPEAVLSLVEGLSRTTLPKPATQVRELLDEVQGAALTGRGGSGKTTALRELATEACQRRLVPITPDLVAYRAGSLRTLLHQQLEAHLEGPIGPRGLDAVLATQDVIVLVDGLTERPPGEAGELLRDLAELRRDWPVRVIATGRKAFQLRAMGSPVYELQGLDWEKRERIAEAVKKGGAAAVRELNDRLGDAVEVPLLLRMGLSLLAEGRDPQSVEQLYGEFVTGLATRMGVPRPNASLAAAGLSCIELVAGERFEADAYWWRSSMRAALDQLAGQRVFELGGVSAEAAIVALVNIGLLHEHGAAGQIGFLHDSFRDYLAARALIEGYTPIPEPLDERYEQVADLLAQGTTEATAGLFLRLADNPVAASSAAEIELDVREPSQELAQQLLRHLMKGFAFPSSELSSTLGMTEWSGPERFYVAIHEGEGGECESVEQFEDEIGHAALIAAYPKRPTSLRIAVLAWQELMRKQLGLVSRSGRPSPIPTNPEELAAAIGKHFREKQAAVAEIAEELCPALRERIVEAVGWRGLDARLQREGRADPLSGRLVHGLTYTYDVDTVAVDVGDPEPFRGGAITVAEHFMHEAPLADASTAVTGALKKLLPSWGP